jgi:PKD repeat protein
VLDGVGPVVEGVWVEFDVTAAISGPGIYSFGLDSLSTNSVRYSSKEGADPPELVIESQTATSAPVADFSGAPTSGEAPLAVAFTDLSSDGPTSWSWSFGDGATSTERNPTHTYAAPGNYTVSLTATNDVGSDTETKVDYIVVNAPPPPVADFSGAPTSGEAPLSVAFSDLSSGEPTSWSWSFGDGATSSAQSPSHTYSAPGLYTVSLTATNDGGSDTATKVEYVLVSAPPPPVADFSATPTSGEAPLSVAFSDLSSGGPTSWSWSFGDGGTSTAQSPSHTYNAPGLYTVSLTVTSSAGSDTETKLDYVLVSAPPPPVAEFAGTPTDGSAPLTVAFSDLSSGAPTSWSWSFGDGATSTEQSPTHTYSAPGLYTVSLTATNAVGSDTETKLDYISVSAPPAEVTLAPTDDARVRSSAPTSNYGSDVVLRAKLDPAGSTHHSYLKFDASGIGASVQSATLRLFVVDGSSDGGSIRLVSNDLLGTSTPWTEGQLTGSSST